MLSPTASNAPGRKDTHPAAWIVPVGGETLAVRGIWDAKTHPKACGLHPRAVLAVRGAFSTTRGSPVVRKACRDGGGACPESRDRPTPGTVPALAARAGLGVTMSCHTSVGACRRPSPSATSSMRSRTS